MRISCLLFISLFLFSKSIAQKDSTEVSEERNLRLSAYPFAFYLPETRLGLGGAGIFTFRFKDEKPSSRRSQFQVVLAYTLNKQILAYVPYELYWQDEKWLAKGELGYYRYFYNFYGIGNDQPSDFVEEYEVYFPRVRVNLQRLIRPSLYTGIQYWFDQFDIRQTAESGQLASGEVPGGLGNTVSGLGWLTTYDNRDNIFYPTKGYFIETTAFFNKPVLGSDFNFNRYILDARTYVKFPWEHVFAANFYTGFITGVAPFNELLFLGGTRRARGFYEGRYRDNSMALLQAEYRFPLFWRFGAVAFTSLGNVAEDYGSLGSAPLRWNIGTGLRFLFNEQDNINLRIDVGFGKNSIGYYLTVGEAF